MQTPSSCVVYTPRKLADAMARTLDPRPRERILEPCIGNGALVRALARNGVPHGRIRALDLDPTFHPSDRYAAVIRGTDFLRWAQDTTERFDKIIANPPYLALNRLRGKLRRAASELRNPLSGRELTLRGNYWHSFLCASLGLLERDGGLCFLLPAAWDYTNYARALREELPAHFEHVDVHRSTSPLFSTLQEGSVILVAHGYRRTNKTNRRTEHATVSDLLDHLASRKEVGVSVRLRRPTSPAAPHVKRLGDLIDIPIGAVCGDADYFLLTDRKRRLRGIPRRACVPVLTRSNHLQVPRVSSRVWENLRDSGERVWLFRPRGTSLQHPAVRRYLRLSVEKGGCRRESHKVQSRRPWYKTHLPEDIQGFISGMSPVGPWIALSRMKGLCATNTLYIVRFKTATTVAEQTAVALGLVTSIARAALAKVGRRYADGLVKFEPGDLKDVPIPLTSRLRGSIQRYRQVVQQIRKGNVAEAQALADDWLKGNRPYIKGDTP
jgi:adenine-specific DNA-methyltransferase